MPAPSPRALRRRLMGFYAASFAVLGVYVPFWPVWLDAQGLSKVAIGWVMAAQIATRTVAGPLWAQVADRRGRPADVVRRLALLSLLSIGAYGFAGSLPAFLLCSVFFGASYPAIHPILDSLAVGHGRRGVAYGRVRAIGSSSFLIAAVLVGWWLDHGDPQWIWGMVLIGMGWMVGAALWLPEDPRPSTRVRALGGLLTQRRFLLFLSACGLVMGSHAAYYSYSALHWRAHDIPSTAVGLLWAEGVIAEIALFAVARRWLPQWSPTALLLLGAGAAVVRWLVIGTCVSVPALALVQWLHAGSFACVHLASLQYIQRQVPDGAGASAQGLVAAATSGLFSFVGIAVAGPLYERHGGDAFLAMAAMAALGGLTSLLLRAPRAPDRAGSQ